MKDEGQNLILISPVRLCPRRQKLRHTWDLVVPISHKLTIHVCVRACVRACVRLGELDYNC